MRAHAAANAAAEKKKTRVPVLFRKANRLNPGEQAIADFINEVSAGQLMWLACVH